jgi:hypothetical protein
MLVKNEILRDVDDGSAGGGVIEKQEDLSASIPMQSNVTPDDGSGFSVPEEYKDKGYLKDVKSLDDVYKKLDGAQSLIGKTRVNFPTDESSDEDRKAFNIASGMPETAAEYAFEFPEGAERDEGFETQIKELFHSAGISGKAATVIQTGFDNIVTAMNEAGAEAKTAEFEQMATDMFGDNTAEVLSSAEALLQENLPEELFDRFEALPNDAKMAMSVVLKGIKDKYINEDNINDLNGGSGGANDIEGLRKKAMELRDNPAYKDGFHKDHEKVNNELTEIYARIGKMS